MRSSGRVAWPAEWGKPKRARWYLALGWLGSWAFIAFVSALAVASSEMAGATKYLVLFGLLFVTIVVVGCDSRVNVRKRGVERVRLEAGRGLVIPYSRIVFLGSALMVVLMFAVFATASYEFATKAGDDVPAPAAAAVVFGLVAALFAAYLWQLVTGRIGLGRVTLTPVGIEHRSWGYRSELPWDDVIGVSALGGGEPEIWIRGHDHAVRKVTLAGRWGGTPPQGPGIAVQAKNLAVDPALVYYTVRFYADHPEARAELAHEASVRRVRAALYP
ncbi:hypothetical protein SAMN05421810_102914 [Amycolatopsis arida]|uniref:PH domain-containing protein n=1 Tax=Amycolatopsis arida TaxID=587909 RepID=A0A1I5R899_9PSEU|nr:hypothetical protein [Amycolatopsis arida]TDX99112.1 hypothetical protein CLV69_101915 [Amycolatopsis arida]SFP54567.1 hypothetical protein SAMN05421810_102914 [Amycolatopsis arida]